MNIARKAGRRQKGKECIYRILFMLSSLEINGEIGLHLTPPHHFIPMLCSISSRGVPKVESSVAMDPNGEIVEEEHDHYNNFKRFEVVSDDSDHSYLKLNRTAKSDPGCFSNASSGVYTKIMQEWRILEKHLPDSIFVRVYERRIDLLRAVIVGAAGTPYHDGLFVFDIAFPSDYPEHPPHVHYRSFGLRLNPNLYANGWVCLSLLNTWVGRKKEKWDPSQSTILQVLVSLQGLVLNEKPYFNEPGHGVLPGRGYWEKNSMAYSENVFSLSCKTMMFLLRRPPKNFEPLIADHFRRRARFILEACNAYTDGRVKVGYYRGDGSSSSTSSNPQVSLTFKTSMQKLFPDLVSSFVRNGASLRDFVQQVKQDRKQASSQPRAQKKQGIAFKLISKLKKILGLKRRKNNGELESSANNITETVVAAT